MSAKTTLPICVLILASFVLGGVSSVSSIKRGIYADAVAHHAAHYAVNPTTGETTFVWNASIPPTP